MGVRDGYKETEVGVIPEDWEVKGLGEALKIRHGRSQKDVESESGTIPILASGGQIGTASAALYSKPSVLIGRKGTINKPYFIDVPFWTVDTLFYSEIFPENSAKFVFYVFNMIDWMQFNEASGVPSLNARTIENIQIALPPLPEQRAIASALSDADALITALEALIAKKQALKQGAMQELLTGRRRLAGFDWKWEERELGDIANIIMGQSPSSNAYNFTNNGLPLFQGNADIKNRRTIQRVWTTEITKLCNENDIIMTVRAPVGVIGVATSAGVLGRGVCAIQAKTIYPEFLLHALINIEDIWESEAQGSTFTSADAKQVKTKILKVPTSVPEQQAIAAILSNMDSEIVQLEGELGKVRALKQGMMQELLTGRIRLVETEKKMKFKIETAKILGFNGKSNFTVKFNKNLDFIIGRNGSGKTRFLSLLFGALTCNFSILASIEFDSLRFILSREGNSRKTIVTIDKHFENIINLVLDYQIEGQESYAKSIYLGDYEGLSGNAKDKIEREIIKLRRKLQELIYINFLTTNRISSLNSEITSVNSTKNIDFSLADSILEKLMDEFHNYQVKTLTDSKDELLEFQKEALTLMLWNPTFDSLSSEISIDDIDEDLIGRAFIMAGISRDLTYEISIHKEKLHNVKSLDKLRGELNPMISDRSGKLYPREREAIMSLPSLRRTQRMSEIFKSIEERRKAISEPMDNFLSIIRKYFKDKDISITRDGYLIFKKDEKVIDRLLLSSGEKQILIIFIENLLKNGDVNVFIIDEPELSLHVRWQMELIDDIRVLNPKAQLIIATHSPEISSNRNSPLVNMWELTHG